MVVEVDVHWDDCASGFGSSQDVLLPRIVEKGLMPRYDGYIQGRFWSGCRAACAGSINFGTLISESGRMAQDTRPVDRTGVIATYRAILRAVQATIENAAKQF
jgi:hypothetical protein